MPDKKAGFPFIDMEFKSLAKDRSNYVATNQAASTGANRGLNERLPKICKLLDAYRDELRRQKAEERVATVAAESLSVNTEPQNGQKQKGRKRKGSATASIEEVEELKLAPPLALPTARGLTDSIPALEKKLELGFKEGQTTETVNAKADKG
ncbi:MAG: hypothetical protein M1839_008596 [Geoglossum umbratile]|nr:MAG: hypothetical protein M1839_008596 [Geoglossum umbratile]